MIPQHFNFAFPATNQDGTLTDAYRQYMQKLELSIPIVGSGSPEGVQEGRLYQLYIDADGAAQAIEYRKMATNIAGDTTQGWRLV